MTMPEQNTKGKFPLTIYMDADLAKRLAVAAEAQEQPAENLITQTVNAIGASVRLRN